jgi:predicted nucleic acid-binding protein
MSRFVLDAGAFTHLASERIDVAVGHELLAPTLVRSQTLALVHEAVHRGELDVDAGRDQLLRIWGMKVRYLGDAVLRGRAWDLAEKFGWASTYDAEYVALTQLQGDAFVTLDAELRRQVQELVRVASIDELRLPAGRT